MKQTSEAAWLRSGPAKALGIEMMYSGFSPASLTMSGPAKVSGIEMGQNEDDFSISNVVPREGNVD